MATGFINFSTKHGVAESTNLKATIVGNIWNIKAAADIDNGCIVKRGDYVAPEYYSEATASNFNGTIIGKAANGLWQVVVDSVDPLTGLVLSVPLIYEEYTTRMQEESNFFNEKDDLLRVYELVVGDVFAVSDECFNAGVAPAVGKKVSVSSKKFTVSDALENGDTTIVDLAGTDLTYTYGGSAFTLTDGTFVSATNTYKVVGDPSASITDAASLLTYVNSKITTKTLAAAGIAIVDQA